MLITNQWLDKLAAARADFIVMLPPVQGPLPGANTNDNVNGDNGDNNGDNDNGAIDDENVMADVQLAQTRGMPNVIIFATIY
jgi:hypothetical protein